MVAPNKEKNPTAPHGLENPVVSVVGPISCEAPATRVDSALTALQKAQDINEREYVKAKNLTEYLSSDPELYYSLQNLKASFRTQLKECIDHLTPYAGQERKNLIQLLGVVNEDFDAFMFNFLKKIDIHRQPQVRERLLKNRGIPRIRYAKMPDGVGGSYTQNDDDVMHNNTLYIARAKYNEDYNNIRAVLYHELTHALLEMSLKTSQFRKKHGWHMPFFEGMTELLSAHALSNEERATYPDSRVFASAVYSVDPAAALNFYVSGDEDAFREAMTKVYIEKRNLKPSEAFKMAQKIIDIGKDIVYGYRMSEQERVEYIAQNIEYPADITPEARRELAESISAKRFDPRAYEKALFDACGKEKTEAIMFPTMSAKDFEASDYFIERVAAEIKGVDESPRSLL